MKCMTCGKGELVTTSENYRYTASGLSNVTLLDVEVAHCPVCGDREVSIPRIAQLHRELAAWVAEQPARLNGEQIRFLRKHLGLSGVDFANVMGVTRETVSRWENDKEPMGVVAERLLRLMAVREQPIEEYPIERLAEVSKEDAPRGRVEMRPLKNGWRAEDAAA